MSQQIEIEFKTMLTETEFNQLLARLPFPKEPIMQTNYYFETEDFLLKRNKSALRIREKFNRYQLTLKEPHPEGTLETSDWLTLEEAKAWLEGSPYPIGKEAVHQRLKKLGINEKMLKLFGHLTTERYVYEMDKVSLMLDKSSYHDIVDYELEVEAMSKEAGLSALQSLLEQEKIVERKAKTKIERFFQSLKH